MITYAIDIGYVIFPVTVVLSELNTYPITPGNPFLSAFTTAPDNLPVTAFRVWFSATSADVFVAWF